MWHSFRTVSSWTLSSCRSYTWWFDLLTFDLNAFLGVIAWSNCSFRWWLSRSRCTCLLSLKDWGNCFIKIIITWPHGTSSTLNLVSIALRSWSGPPIFKTQCWVVSTCCLWSLFADWFTHGAWVIVNFTTLIIKLWFIIKTVISYCGWRLLDFLGSSAPFFDCTWD